MATEASSPDSDSCSACWLERMMSFGVTGGALGVPETASMLGRPGFPRTHTLKAAFSPAARGELSGGNTLATIPVLCGLGAGGG